MNNAQALRNRTIFFLSISCIFYSLAIARQRSVMFFLDQKHQIKTDKFDSVTAAFVIALEQKAAPIVVSKNIMQDFLSRKKRFSHNAKQNGSPQNLYVRLHNEITRQFNKGITNKTKSSKIKRQTTQNKKQVRNALGDTKTPIGKLFTQLKKHSHYQLVIEESLVYGAALTDKHWRIYKMGQHYLLIPQWYEKQTLRSSPRTTGTKTIKDVSSGRTLKDSEVALGLKYENFIQIPYKNFLKNVFKKSSKSDSATELKKQFDRLFITKNDIPLASQQLLLPHWNIYVCGHGGYKKNKKIDHLEQDQKKFNQQVKAFGYVIPSLPTVDTKKLTKTELITRSTKAKTIQSLKKLQQTIRSTLIENNRTIAGITFDTFDALIQFAQKNIFVSTLWYDTHQTRGHSLNMWYATGSITDKLSFTTVSTTVDERDRIHYFPHTITNDLELRGSTVRFMRFFNQLQNESYNSIFEVSNLIHPHLEHSQTVIRFSGLHYFMPIKLEPSVYPLTKQVALKFEKTDTIKINVPRTKVVLLYLPYYFATPRVHGHDRTEKKSPWFIPMFTDEPIYFEDFKAPHAPLTQLINHFCAGAFLSETSHLLTPRLFFIKKLHCYVDIDLIQKKEHSDLKNVLIINALVNKKLTGVEEPVSGVFFTIKGKKYKQLRTKKGILISGLLMDKELATYRKMIQKQDFIATLIKHNNIAPTVQEVKALHKKHLK